MDLISTRLETCFDGARVTVVDESHLHAGHEGARDGRGHYRVRVVAPRFAGMTTLARHREVYRVLHDLMTTDIHALSISALTPEEAERTAPDPF
jgi:BolA protein